MGAELSTSVINAAPQAGQVLACFETELEQEGQAGIRSFRYDERSSGGGIVSGKRFFIIQRMMRTRASSQLYNPSHSGLRKTPNDSVTHAWHVHQWNRASAVSHFRRRPSTAGQAIRIPLDECNDRTTSGSGAARLNFLLKEPLKSALRPILKLCSEIELISF